jgi:hypothetical protein
MSGWARWVALAVAVLGTVLTEDARFALSCGLGAVIDIATFEAIASRMHRNAEDDPGVAGVLFAARVAVKAALVSLAFVVPALFSFAGMAAGVLVVDVTLITVGAAYAASSSVFVGTWRRT